MLRELFLNKAELEKIITPKNVNFLINFWPKIRKNRRVLPEFSSFDLFCEKWAKQNKTRTKQSSAL